MRVLPQLGHVQPVWRPLAAHCGPHEEHIRCEALGEQRVPGDVTLHRADLYPVRKQAHMLRMGCITRPLECTPCAPGTAGGRAHERCC